MQKIPKLLLFISLIWASGCGDDDDSAAFIGVWEGSSVVVSDCSTNSGTTRRSCDDTRCYRLTLIADGTYTFQEGLPVRSGTWSESGGEITLCVEEDGEQVCETYFITLNSAVLTLGTVNEANGCITTQIFDRVIEVEDEETPDA